MIVWGRSSRSQTAIVQILFSMLVLDICIMQKSRGKHGPGKFTDRHVNVGLIFSPFDN